MNRVIQVVGAVLALGVGGAEAARSQDENVDTRVEASSRNFEDRAGMGGADHINSQLRSDAEALWARAGKAPASTSQLSGPVLKAKGRTLYLQNAQGAVVAFDLRQLRLLPGVQLREGEEVRVTFEPRGTRNLGVALERIVDDAG